jgi:hypothetical protein
MMNNEWVQDCYLQKTKTYCLRKTKIYCLKKENKNIYIRETLIKCHLSNFYEALIECHLSNFIENVRESSVEIS